MDDTTRGATNSAANSPVPKYESIQMKALALCCRELTEAIRASRGSDVKARILNTEWVELMKLSPEARTPQDIEALNASAQSLFNRMKEFALQQISALSL
jgi:hypothetical protein